MNSKELKREGYSIYYQVYGDENNDCIVFLHPAFLDNTCYYHQVDVFSKDYYVITIDLIGHGLSQVENSKHQLDESAKHVAEILNIENKKKAHFIGVSLGSLIIQHVAYVYPNLVNSLVVVGGYSIHRDNKEIMKAQNKETFKMLFMILFAFKKFKRYVANVTVISAIEREIVYESLDKFTRKSLRVLQGIGKIFIPQSKTSDIPILLVCGEYDLDVEKRSIENWHSIEPKSQLFFISNAGHCANMDNPEEFNKILLEFLK